MVGKLPRPKRGFVVPYHKYTGRYNPLNVQLDEYDQQVCDDEMLQELDVLEPKGIRKRKTGNSYEQ